MRSRPIVIVDDEPSVRSGLSNLLQSEGFCTLAFASAEALLADRIALREAALFIIDVRLQGMSGVELFSELSRRLEAPPAILISGDGDESMLWVAIELGALAFLPKPIEIDTLFTHIRQLLSPGEAPS